MQTTGTIYADGSILLDGYVPMKWRLLALTENFLVYHSPGGHWSDNGGRRYGPASVEVETLKDLRPGNQEGTWRFALANRGPKVSFHPTPSEAVRQVVNKLPERAPRIIKALREQNDVCDLR